MEHKNCEKCGKVFLSVRSRVCPACEKNEEEDFDKIRTYLEKNPLNTITQTSEDTGVSFKRILKFLKDERLEMTAGLQKDFTLECTGCGEPITKGLLCYKCMKQYGEELSGLKDSREKQKKSGGMGMHSIRSGDKRK